MRFPGPILLCLLLVQSAVAQTIMTGSATPKASPAPPKATAVKAAPAKASPAKAAPAKAAPASSTTRPVLLGTGPNSLINRIDAAGLAQKGQKDAAIMFACSITKTGDIAWSGTYRGTEGSKLLEEELQKHLAPASAMKFIPAVYNGQPVDAIYYGTVTFAIVEDKPRLRIFSNQETPELENENNFIGPQPFFGGPSQFTGLHYPGNDKTPVQVDGVAVVTLTVDATGTLQGIFLSEEEPPFLGFGDAALHDFGHARFIPAFRDGKPVACQIKLPVYYRSEALVRGFWETKPGGQAK